MGVCDVSNWDDDDYENDHQQPQQSKGQGLRAQLEAALKQNKELQKQLDDTKGQLRKEAVARVIQGKGYKAKVAKLIPGDVEPTEEAITKWLDEWADVFGGDSLKETPAEAEGEKPKPPVEPNADDDLSNAQYAERMQAMGQVTGQASGPVKQEDVLRKLQDPAMDRKTLMEMIHAAGGGYGSG